MQLIKHTTSHYWYIPSPGLSESHWTVIDSWRKEYNVAACSRRSLNYFLLAGPFGEHIFLIKLIWSGYCRLLDRTISLIISGLRGRALKVVISYPCQEFSWPGFYSLLWTYFWLHYDPDSITQWTFWILHTEAVLSNFVFSPGSNKNQFTLKPKIKILEAYHNCKDNVNYS